jgi:hypothetical protein
MDITSEHIQSKKEIGTLKGKPVIELVTTGGLHLVVTAKNGKFETIGTGPHRAISRYIAQKREPEMQLNDMAKSEDEISVMTFVHRLPEYFQLTVKIRELEGSDA